jgi:hypothetical protein
MRHLLLTALALATLPAFAQDPGLARCRALTDAGARLACYDALADAGRAVSAAPAKPAAATATAPTPSSPSSPATPVAAAPVPTGVAAFGLPEARRPDAVESVDSSVGPNFAGWGPNSRIRLANGQVWQVIDGTSVVLPEGPRKVSVKRGMLSSYYLDFEGLKTSPRVRRVE